MKAPSHKTAMQSTKTSIESFMEKMPYLFKLHTDNTVVYLPESCGTGFSIILHLEDGLKVRSLNFSLKSDFEFLRLARQNEEEKTFQLYYFLDTVNFHFSVNNEKEVLSPATFSNILLISNDMQLRGRFEKNETVKVVIISFSVSWLQKNGFDTLESCKAFLTHSKERDKGIMMMQYPDITDYNIATEINKTHIPGNNFTFPIKANCLKLIERFFEAIEKRKHINLKQSQTANFLQMVEVEKAIAGYLTTSLPLIKDLSKQFHMSDSNLKKHFRIVYGKNIYEYYLEQKMNQAKSMLMNENISISRVAHLFGYEKIAGFSKAFTKMFGILPSQVRLQLPATVQKPPLP